MSARGLEHSGAWHPRNELDVSLQAPSLVKANHVDSDSSKPRRQLYGYSVSSKRYAIYEKIDHDDIKGVEPKPHGLGYLAASKEEKDGEEGNWIAEAWDWLLRSELGLKCRAPPWLDIPAMMPIVISTPNILQRLDPRPFRFLLLPQVDSGGGNPADVDNSRFTLVTSFTSKRSEWLKSECINIFDGKVYQLALEHRATGQGNSANLRKRALSLHQASRGQVLSA